jgi:hypothetical protein
VDAYLAQSIGGSVASASTITPTGPIFHVTGTAAIATINLPYVGFTGSLDVTADAAWTTTLAGNIATAISAYVGQNIRFTYDGTKWQVSPAVPAALLPTGGFSASTPGNPAGVGSPAAMMGLAGTAIPTKSGKVLFVMSGQIANNTINDGATVQLRYGTGVAPINGAAVTGTQLGAAQTHTSLVAGDTGGFCISSVISGLAVGTALWIDASLVAVTGGTATMTGVSISAIEL